MWREQSLDADHVVPRVLGGADGPLRLTHSACNRRAGRLLQARLAALAASCPSCRAKVLQAPVAADLRTDETGTSVAAEPQVLRPALGFFTDNEETE
jgi:hypothetical protein